MISTLSGRPVYALFNQHHSLNLDWKIIKPVLYAFLASSLSAL
ncbi:MAG: hypothetical protein QXQ57_04215 [Sulfolobales archaeon]